MASARTAGGRPEPLAAIELVRGLAGKRRITLGTDKAYDTANFVLECREENVTRTWPRTSRRPAARASTLAPPGHPGYAVSLRIRKRIEEGFGWTKEIAGLAQVKLRGLARVNCAFVLSLAAYSLVRLPKLLAGPHNDRPDGLPADRPVADRRGRHLGAATISTCAGPPCWTSEPTDMGDRLRRAL